MRGLSVSLSLLLFCFRFASGQVSEYNEIYKEGKVFSHKPNAFLVEMARGRRPGKGLDVGMGQGRNSLYLARHGWAVTGFDASDEGVRLARAEAAHLGLKIAALVKTFEQFDFGENQWDLIVLTNEPTRAIAPKVGRALKAGGAVVVEDRHRETRKVWPDGGLFDDNDLLFLFPGLRVLRYEDVWARSDWQAERLNERLVRLLAEKPRVEEPGCLWAGKAVPEGGAMCWDHAVRFLCQEGGWLFTHESCK
jgi:SAM-dependent methyltransferase